MNNDLISRSALKEGIRKRLGISSLKYLTEQEKVIVDEIDNAPRFDIPNFGGSVVPDPLTGWEYVQRPKGEWLITGEEQGALGIMYKKIKCSNCGWEHSLVIPDNYCSNCGTYMRGSNQ